MEGRNRIRLLTASIDDCPRGLEHDPAYTRCPGRTQECWSEPGDCREQKHGANVLKCRGETRCISQIACNHVDAVGQPSPGRRARERTHRVSAGMKLLDDRATDRGGCAGDQNSAIEPISWGLLL